MDPTQPQNSAPQAQQPPPDPLQASQVAPQAPPAQPAAAQPLQSAPQQTPITPVPPADDPWANPRIPDFMQPDAAAQPPQQATPTDQNPYMPPPPGPYTPPDGRDQQVVPAPEQVAPQNTTEMANQAITKNRRQAKVFIVSAIIFSLIAIGALAALAIFFVGDDATDEGTTTLNAQLQADVNTLGLGIISYNESVGPLSLTPEEVGVLQVTHLPEALTDPRTDAPYILTTAIPTEGEIQYVVGGVCRSDDSVSVSGDESNFAVRTLLDNGILYCLEKSEVKAAE